MQNLPRWKDRRADRPAALLRRPNGSFPIGGDAGAPAAVQLVRGPLLVEHRRSFADWAHLVTRSIDVMLYNVL